MLKDRNKTLKAVGRNQMKIKNQKSAKEVPCTPNQGVGGSKGTFRK